MMRKHFSHPPSNQKGATLIIALIMLVLIMTLGITAFNSSKVQFKLAGNVQFEEIAMNNAETAVAAAENWLSTTENFKNTGFTTYSNTTPQLHPIDHLQNLTAPANDPLTMAWDGTSDLQVGSSNQRYMIQLMSAGNTLLGSGGGSGGRTSTGCNKVNTYMITARGQATRGATKFVQSYYSVKSC
jgi:Tfp pilus assembly protein PilX